MLSLPNTPFVTLLLPVISYLLVCVCVRARPHLQEWTLALSENFKFNLPVDINWEFFDGRFLARCVRLQACVADVVGRRHMANFKILFLWGDCGAWQSWSGHELAEYK